MRSAPVPRRMRHGPSSGLTLLEFCSGGGNVKHLSPEQVGALIKAAQSDRDRLLLTII